jgi:hypothetical protein
MAGPGWLSSPIVNREVMQANCPGGIQMGGASSLTYGWAIDFGGVEAKFPPRTTGSESAGPAPTI